MQANAMNTFPESNRGSADAPFVSDDAKWNALLRRDRSADGHFFYSVRTTGIYCSPSCAAPRPLRKHVVFHHSPEDAERAGYRPCKRCAPNGQKLAQLHAAAVARACRIIERSEATPNLHALARACGMSAFHFHRVFKSTTGLTPKKYATAHRTRRVRQQLTTAATVTDAIYSAGFNSTGSFYAGAPRALGMTPSRFRKGGAGTVIQFTISQSPLGLVLVGASDIGVCAIFLGDNPDTLQRALEKQFPHAHLIPGDRKLKATVARVVEFIELPSAKFDLPLDIRGTAFQQRVWEALREIPLGTTVSYRDLANQIGAPKAVRAVARACAANAIAVVVPCHRVVRSNGDLCGYRWGAHRKDELLKREAAGHATVRAKGIRRSNR